MTARPQHPISHGGRIQAEHVADGDERTRPVLRGARDPRPRGEPDPRVGRVAPKIMQRGKQNGDA
jgi:hypothetical protein